MEKNGKNGKKIMKNRLLFLIKLLKVNFEDIWKIGDPEYYQNNVSSMR